MTIEFVLMGAMCAIFGVVIGSQYFIIRRLDSQNQRQSEMLFNYATYNRAEKPKAEVYDPGPVDDETKAMVEMRTREIDRLASAIADEGQVNIDRAREEAERMLAMFEQRGVPD